MSATERLREHFWGLDLNRGNMELTKREDMYCYFIVEHTSDSEFAYKQALSLLVAGCRNFVFYGKAEAIWHLQTDLADIQMNPEMEEVALTSSVDSFDDFVDGLAELLSIRPFVPFHTYLIYDDREIYAEVLKRLKIAGKTA
ncbi:MAG: hypothetical protein IKG82_13130 [Oscillospiraceae bacterium]|nr:hypothetical protein [Oscillospiraceae bacterium]MBR4199671.1 hypothetical protein [Oscillospiraceae bacterium]